MTNEEAWEILLNAPVRFGLVAQGHIATIEAMLAEGQGWEAIGDKIGWCPKTAEEHYQRYKARQHEKASQVDPAVVPEPGI